MKNIFAIVISLLQLGGLKSNVIQTPVEVEFEPESQSVSETSAKNGTLIFAQVVRKYSM